MPQVSDIVLTLSCEDKPGIVAAVANLFALQGFNIRESAQFEDVYTHRFFMRTVLDSCEGKKSIDAIKASFQPLADRYNMNWGIYNKHTKPRVLIAVSQWGHCLSHLLNVWKNGSLPIDVVGVVSNHEVMRPLCEWYQVPYHYLPISNNSDRDFLKLVQSEKVELLVLARYMRILSELLCKHIEGRAINIHHSFLPSFKGAKPYHQAYSRGVKLIGATAHYVTPELDEGPIIEQSVERVNHTNTPGELVEIGRDIEAIILTRAIRWHIEHRILLNGQKTVVFK